MAETGSVTYSDVSSFGVSDTGLTQYRTPDPLPLPIPERDRPFQPRPLTETYLSPYLSVFGPQYDLLPEERQFGTFGTTKFNAPDNAPWWYLASGRLATDQDVRANNADVIAAYLVDQRVDLVQRAIDAGTVSRDVVERGVALAPTLAVQKQNALQWARYRKVVGDAEERAGFVGSPLGQFLIGSFTVGASIVFPPAAPFLAAGYGAYVLGTTIPEQVETGQVKIPVLVNQLLATAAIAGGVSATSSAFSAAPSTGVASTVQPGQFLTPAPRTGNISFASSIGQPVAGNSGFTASLFNLPVAPELSQAARLGLSTTQLLTPEISTLSQVTTFVKQNPGKVLGAGQTGVTLIDRLLEGDWAGIANVVLGASGVPVNIRPEVPTPPLVTLAPRAPVGGGQGGGSMLFSSPADPASTNVWPWVLGALLLGVLVFVVRRKG